MPGQRPPVSCLITCEHATNRVPPEWRWLFRDSESVLESHEAWDPGALDLARALADELRAPLLEGEVSRLLIDLNRSAGHPRRFSDWTRALSEQARCELESQWWLPHWRAYRQHVESQSPPVVHLACHSFTPKLNGRKRRTDIGLLYDPSRAGERVLCRELRRELESLRPELRIRMNDPYRGTANGLGQQHRKHYAPGRLVTVEIEINQRLVDMESWPQAIRELVVAASQALARSF